MTEKTLLEVIAKTAWRQNGFPLDRYDDPGTGHTALLWRMRRARFDVHAEALLAAVKDAGFTIMCPSPRRKRR